MYRTRRLRRYPSSARRDQGFTYVAVLLAVAASLTVAAVVAPSVFGSAERARVQSGWDQLEGYRTAVERFKADVDRYPRNISHLSRPITNPPDQNSCAGNYTNQQVSRWNGPDEENAPYHLRVIPASDTVPVAVGRMQSQLVRIPPTGNQNSIARLSFMVHDVYELDARALGQLVDGNMDSATGTVRWTAPDADGFVTVDYGFQITGC